MPRTDTAPSMLPGFGVLFEKEMLEARRSKRMVAFLLLMTAVVLLVPVVGYINIEHFGGSSRHQIDAASIDNMVGTWSALVGFLGSLMVIAGTVDAVSRERALGISAWVITKPVSRLSYLLAKSAAHALIGIIVIVVIPSLVWLTVSVALFQGMPVAPILLAMVILSVEVIVLSFFTIALGVPFRSVAPVTIVALGLWFVPNVVPAISSLQWTYRILPSYLPVAAYAAAVSEADSATVTIPLASLVIAALAFAAAVVQFERQEL